VISDLSYEIRPTCRYEQGATLAGILYFHRISDRRMTGISRQNFTMFRKLCGDNALQNVVIVTNMWGDVNPSIGIAREAQLMREDIFFKPVLDKGAQVARHDNTPPSAKQIIRLLLDNHPLPLRIQEELVDEGKDIIETGAGEELNRELNAQIRKYQQEMEDTIKEMQQAMAAENEELKKELEIKTRWMEKEIERFQHDSQRLESDYKKEKERLEARVLRMELDTMKGLEHYQKQIEELRNLFLSAQTAASEAEKAQKRAQIEEIRKAGRRPNFFSKLGGLLTVPRSRTW
jgi:hypothetical protein